MLMNNTTVGVRIRELLLRHPEGLTIDYISRVTKHPYDCVAPVLQRTYGCYIAEWIDHPNHYHLQVALWKCVPVPANAPSKIKMKNTRPVEEKPTPPAVKVKKVKEVKQKPTPPEKPVYKPQKTVWVNVPSWGQAA